MFKRAILLVSVCQLAAAQPAPPPPGSLPGFPAPQSAPAAPPPVSDPSLTAPRAPASPGSLTLPGGGPTIPGGPGGVVNPGNLSVPPGPGAAPIVRSGPVLTLPDAAITALRNHPNLRFAQAQIDQAQASIRAASAPFFPSLNGNMGYSNSEAQREGVGGQQVVIAGGVRNYQVGVRASQLLTDFGRTQANIDAADENKLAAEWQKSDTVQTLLLTVAENYFSVLRAQQDVQIFLDNVRNAELQLLRARGFFEAGTRARIEVTRAEAELATSRVGLIQTQNAEQRVRAAFLNSLGINQTQEFQLLDTSLLAPGWSRDEAVLKARDTRPDLRAAFARIRSAEARLRSAEADYYPRLNTNFSYGWSESGFIPQPYNWSVGVNMEIPIINEPLRSANVQSAEASMRQQEASQESLALQIQQEATEAWLNMQESVARLEASRAGLRSNEENYRLASERYNVGVGSSLEVSDAQRLLVQARSLELQARFDVQLAIARLYRRAGALTIDALLPLPRPQ